MKKIYIENRSEAARAISDIIRRFYSDPDWNPMDISIGFCEDGSVDYGYDEVNMSEEEGEGVVFSVYSTATGWSMGDGDYESPSFWTQEFCEWVGKKLTGEWMPADDEYEVCFKS